MKLKKGSKETLEMLHKCYGPEVRAGLSFQTMEVFSRMDIQSHHGWLYQEK
jgi:hypothetical protein